MSAAHTIPLAVAPPDDDGALLSIPAVSRYLSVSRATVYALMDSGALRYVRLPGVRARRIRRQDLVALVDANTVGQEAGR